MSDCCGDKCFDFTANYLSFEPGGIGRHLTFLGVQGLLYFTVLLLVESRLLHQFFYTLRRQFSPPVVYIDADEVSLASEDEDIEAERRRITEMPLNSLLATNSVVVNELSRMYAGGGNHGTIVAVDRLSFGVQRGECFGLLGINGAGKTTTFQMLTGDIFPTDGYAYINGYSVMQDIRQVDISVTRSCLLKVFFKSYCSMFFIVCCNLLYTLSCTCGVSTVSLSLSLWDTTLTMNQC